MAKRKRLTPAQKTYLEGDAPLETKGMFPLGVARHTPPIAQVAGDAATKAALQNLTDEMRAARSEGRLVQALELELVDTSYLVRDRMGVDEVELSVLVESLRIRGQQTPIEVVDLAEGRFGLISGWRRMAALGRLWAETGDERFKTVKALLRRPESASDAYLAMVEENEIRVGLSYYERARIAARAAEQGVYPDEPAALRGLFAAASRAKRSKIGSFLTIYHALDNDLNFAAAIPERLGLKLSKVLKNDPASGRRIAKLLRAHPAATAEDEAVLLNRAIRAVGEKQSLTSGLEINAKTSDPAAIIEEAVHIQSLTDASGTKLILSGSGVNEAFRKRLQVWLHGQG